MGEEGCSLSNNSKRKVSPEDRIEHVLVSIFDPSFRRAMKEQFIASETVAKNI